jgi:hypothetical protein
VALQERRTTLTVGSHAFIHDETARVSNCAREMEGGMGRGRSERASWPRPHGSVDRTRLRRHGGEKAPCVRVAQFCCLLALETGQQTDCQTVLLAPSVST